MAGEAGKIHRPLCFYWWRRLGMVIGGGKYQAFFLPLQLVVPCPFFASVRAPLFFSLSLPSLSSFIVLLFPARTPVPHCWLYTLWATKTWVIASAYVNGQCSTMALSNAELDGLTQSLVCTAAWVNYREQPRQWWPPVATTRPLQGLLPPLLLRGPGLLSSLGCVSLIHIRYVLAKENGTLWLRPPIPLNPCYILAIFPHNFYAASYTQDITIVFLHSAESLNYPTRTSSSHPWPRMTGVDPWQLSRSSP